MTCWNWSKSLWLTDWWQSVTQNWTKLRALLPRERQLLLQALVLLPLAVVGLRLLGFRRLQFLLVRAGRLGRPSGLEKEGAALRTADLVALAVRKTFCRTSCL